MNKSAIWMIIGLMTAALIGIVGIQLYWIKESIQQNEEKFDKNVYAVSYTHLTLPTKRIV